MPDVQGGGQVGADLEGEGQGGGEGGVGHARLLGKRREAGGGLGGHGSFVRRRLPCQGHVEPKLALGHEERAAVRCEVEQPDVHVRACGGRQARQQGHGADQIDVLGHGRLGEAEHVVALPDGA
ncbi:hypothetical protein GCM10018965_040850 [Nonomuraea roseola]